MRLTSIAGVGVRQALVTGSVEDALTGNALTEGVVVALHYQDPPTRRYPLVARLQGKGRFVFEGDPRLAFPRLEADETLDLRLDVRAKRYRDASASFTLSAAVLALTEEVRQIAGSELTVETLSAPVFEESFALQPQPLHLAGRVVEAEDPERPIAGAQVSITGDDPRGPVDTDAEGYFRFLELPVALSIELRIMHPDFATARPTLTLDYGHPVIQTDFRLEPPP